MKKNFASLEFDFNVLKFALKYGRKFFKLAKLDSVLQHPVRFGKLNIKIPGLQNNYR